MFDPAILLSFSFIAVFALTAVILSRKMKAGWSPRQQRKMLRAILLFFLVSFIFGLASQIANGRLSRNWWMPALQGVCVAVLAWQAFRKRSDSELQKAYAVEPGRCPHCGYDLTGNVSGICPECAWSIPAKPMQVEDPRWAMWWNRWTIDYLENYRKTLITMVVFCFVFSALTIWSGLRLRVSGPFIILPAFMFLNFAINTVRVIAYGLRNSKRVLPTDDTD